MTTTKNKSSPEVHERARRLVMEGARQHESRWTAIVSISVENPVHRRSSRGSWGRADLRSAADCPRRVSHDHRAKRTDPSLLSDRARRDEDLKPEIARVFAKNLRVWGVRTAWRPMRGEGFDGARCPVARRMKVIGIEGGVRGKKPKTTIPDNALLCPLNKVNRQFHAPAPNVVWASDFTHVAPWPGLVYVAFVIDAFARRIVGGRVSRTATAGVALDAFEQAGQQRQPDRGRSPQSGRGSQHLSIRYTERLAESGIEPSVGSVGDSYDTALAETINGQRAGSFTDAAHGAALMPWTMPHWNGRLGQQPPSAGGHREYPASRSGGKLLRHSGKIRHGRVTKTNQLPVNPAWVNRPAEPLSAPA